MSRVVYRYYTEAEPETRWCEEHVMSVPVDEWEDHLDVWH